LKQSLQLRKNALCSAQETGQKFIRQIKVWVVQRLVPYRGKESNAPGELLAKKLLNTCCLLVQAAPSRTEFKKLPFYLFGSTYDNL